ncbi:MAG TPA: dipeptide epimerase [Ktedonobacteraceae bacterium]|nr:dipeptide epimerase [Ktedonobacteraceae bacterium]
MKLDIKPFDLKLTTPFRISRHVQYSAANVLAQITHEGVTGLGEAAPSEHYGEYRETVLATLALLGDELGEDPLALEDILSHLDRRIRLNPSAKAALDMALYDLVGKLLNVPVYKLLGLSAARTPRTSFTIGIDTPENMARKALVARDYPILKIKVGTRNDVANLKAIREVSNAVIRVDANTAWTPKEAVRAINELAEYNIEFVEQPVQPHDLAGLKYVREHVPLPIITDESSITVEDIPRVAECTDGINIKLMKCGGLRHALKMIHVARAHNLSIMLGCMIESSLAITAAAHLSPLVDYADLDGHLLVDNDPYSGVQVEHGKLVLPDGPGLGVVART